MGIIGKLWSAVNALVASLHGLAQTVNTIDAELRLRVGLEAFTPPALAGNGHPEGERPALTGKGRKSKGE